MRPCRLLMIALITALCLSCAAGPAPEQAPPDIHEGTRYLNKAAAYYRKGCYSKALQYIQEAHERFVAADYLQGTAQSLNTMANIYFRMDDFSSALAFFDESITLFRQLNDKRGQVRALSNKAAVLIAAKRLEDADKALELADNTAGDQDLLPALRLKTRALLSIERNDPIDAEALLTRSLRRVSDTDRALQADIHYTIGHAMLISGHAQQAIDHLETALELDRAAGAYFQIGMDLAELGACFQQVGQYAEAIDRFNRSIKIFALMAAPQKVSEVLAKLQASAGKSDRPEPAVQATLKWAELWLAGRREANLCR